MTSVTSVTAVALDITRLGEYCVTVTSFVGRLAQSLIELDEVEIVVEVRSKKNHLLRIVTSGNQWLK